MPSQRKLPGVRVPKDPWTLYSPRGWRFPRNFRTPPKPVGPISYPTQGMFDFETNPFALTRRVPSPPSGLVGETVRTVQGEVVPPDLLTGDIAPPSKPPSRFGGIGRGLGKALGILGTASTAYPFLRETFFPEDDVKESWGPSYRPGARYGNLPGYRPGVKPPPSIPLPSADEFESELPPFEPTGGPTIEAAAALGSRPNVGGRTIPNVGRTGPRTVRPARIKPPSPPINTGLASSFANILPPESNVPLPLPPLPDENLFYQGLDRMVDSSPQLPQLDRSNPFIQGISGRDGLEAMAPMSSDMDASNSQILNPPKEPSSIQRYISLFDEFPEYEKPSIWRRIVAGLAGSSQAYFGNAGEGYETVKEIINEPRNRKLAEWQMRMNELEPIARIESQEKMNEARIAERDRKSRMIFLTKNAEIDLKRDIENNNVEEFNRRMDILEARNEALGRKLVDGGDNFMYWVDSTDQSIEKTEIPSLKYEQFRSLDRYRKSQAASSASRAASAAALVPSTIKKNEATAARGTTGSQTVEANRRAMLEQRASDAIMQEMFRESGAKTSEEFLAAFNTPVRQAEFKKRVEAKINQLMTGGR